MGEAVLSHHGLVPGQLHAAEALDQFGGLLKDAAIDAQVDAVQELKGQHDFLSGRIAAALAHAVHGGGDHLGAGAEGGHAVGHGHAEIVVDVDLQGDLLEHALEGLHIVSHGLRRSGAHGVHQADAIHVP